MDWYTCSDTFVTVVNKKSFAEASRTLYTTQSSISKRIAWLEDRLGAQLLIRSTRKLQLTEEGETYYQQIIPLLNEWKALKDNISTLTKGITGEIRIAVPSNAASYYVSNTLPAFLERYPDIKFTLLLMREGHQLIENQIDVFISPQRTLVENATIAYQALAGPRRHLYASPAYLAQHGEPKNLEDLQTHNCLLHTSHIHSGWKFQDQTLHVQGNFKSNYNEALIKAAVGGMGIIFVPDTFVIDEVQSNSLQLVLPGAQSENMTIYAYYPKRSYTPSKTRVLLDFLLEALGPATPHEPV